ncbi:hypothetical protein [uncultured Piscinibacter sp.]|uniref:hypothetical protein n=1 Tax=uncultured Piscinibacter sp. TaxID=1131835 RepID=UPI00262ABFBF|nr:hypothetical protein [uncultured Piscinibacter sp.]
MLRMIVLLLVLANLLFFAWTRGWLEGATGLRPHPEREPQRLARQKNPDLVVVLTPSAASAALTPRTVPGAPLPAASAASAPLRGACLEAGPFATGASVSAVAALQALQPALPAGSWVDVTIERPGSWMVYLGRYPNRDALARQQDELKRNRVSYQEVTTPAEYTPGLSLGRFNERAAAEQSLAQLGQRGVRSARVVELAAPTTLHMLRVQNADAALADRLATIRSPALGRGFVPCAN